MCQNDLLRFWVLVFLCARGPAHLKGLQQKSHGTCMLLYRAFTLHRVLHAADTYLEEHVCQYLKGSAAITEQVLRIVKIVLLTGGTRTHSS